MDGQVSHPPASDHVGSFTAKAHGHVPEGAIVIADPNLIFNGEFKRTGLDLVLSHDDHEFVVHDYFRGDKRAAIASPDGAHLTGDIVSALTGYVQVAQAAPGAAAAQVIGHVTKLTGSATAIRNGVSVILNNGDNVEKGDVVSTGSDSTLGVTFIDGTVFGLSSNARMVLNEMVYDPNGSNNSSLLSLVAGTITFVAGETAKHGDMKIDTPVATMGIRGTAVLTEINFVVPAGGGDPQPEANFQVLVEPNGTTGSYILFDKLTLLPIATVNQAGQMIQISGGNVSVTNALLSPDVQKLITDVFTLKFTDNNTNTKLTTNFTDTITQNGNLVFIKTDTGATATATFTNTVNNGAGPGQGGTDKGADRFPGPPDARTLDANGNVTTAFATTEHAAATGDRADTTGAPVPSDTVSIRVTFVDQNLGDRPTVSVSLDASNYTYKDAGHHDVTTSLTALQKQDIAATQVQIAVAADGGNNNNGSAVLTYTVPDHVFDFLGAGETLTLTYIVSVNDNFAVNPEARTIPITITITGTNDKPVISTSVPTITFSGGTSVPGGPLTTDVPTSGTLTFSDVDLTDTHSVSVVLTSAVLPDGTVPPGPLAMFENAMSVLLEKDSTKTADNAGIIDWSLADLPAYVADFIPKGEVLTLTYTVTLNDSQGATSTQTINVTIKGTDSPAVVWIATKETGAPSGGLWGDKLNWETHTVPTINDDVMVITDQLRGLTPSYPVTIDAAAFAKSLIMDDYNTSPPELINNSTLTIAGALTLNADSKFTNSVGGHVLVGGKIDVEATTRNTGTVTNTSTITNAGTLTLAAGGTIDSRTSISNSGMINLSGGTLALKSNIANTGGALKADVGTKLIVDAATIAGGTVIIAGTLALEDTAVLKNGVLTNTSKISVSGTGNALDGETATNTGVQAVIDVSGALTLLHATSLTNASGGSETVEGSLTLADTSSISGGSLTIGSTGMVTLDDSAAISNSAIGNGGTLDLQDASSVSGGDLTNSGTLALEDTAVLKNGVLTNTSKISVSGTGNALDGETATNTGLQAVIDVRGALTLLHATSLTNASGGSETVEGSLTLADTSSISGGSLTIGSTGTVTLDDSAAISNSAIGNGGTLAIAGDATLLDDVVTNAGTVEVDDGRTLILSGTKISGGTIDNYSGASGGTLHITGDSTIDGDATLNHGAVAVDAGVFLTLNDASVSAATIANGGTVKVDANDKLTMTGASLTGGALTVSGTLASSGTTTITDATISNSYLIEATLGGLLALVATTPAAAIANSGIIQANGAELDINGEAVTNTDTIAAINAGTLKLIATKVTNTGGTVSVETGSTLDLDGATIDGGTVTISGTLESSGTSAINNANITITGTISVTGTLTFDPPVPVYTIVNQNVMAADGGEIDVVQDAITNTGTLEAIHHGTLKLTDVVVTNKDGTVLVDGTSALYLTAVTVNDGTLSNAGHLYAVSGSNTVTAAVTNTGTIEVQAGTLDLASGLSGIGTLIIDDGATLELGGADAQTVTFAGGIDTLKLDNTSYDFTGTITGQATTAGIFTVTGDANITTSQGDALDFTASGGTTDGRGDIVLTPTGTLSGKNNGIAVTQSGIGHISLTTVGDVSGANGDGIVLDDGATGAGDITATIGGGVSGAVGLDVVSHGNGAVTITNNGHITGNTSFGIHVEQDDAGAAGSTHITNTNTGSVVGANGVAAISIQENGTATIINSGTIGPDADLVSSTTYAIVETGGAITINNTGHINGDISVASATFNNDGGGTWTVAGSGVFGDASSIVNHGAIDLHGASISGAGLSVENSNDIDSWGTTSISGIINNTGTIEVNDGTLKLVGSLSGSGSVTIDQNATLDVNATVSQTITFSGSGAELRIDTSSFGGSVAGLAATDKLDLFAIKYDVGTSATYDATTGNLLVSDTHGDTITVKLTGHDYSNAHFAGSSDGNGGTLITLKANDDAPAFTAAEAAPSVSFSELANTTNSTALDPTSGGSGTIHFTDVDLTDRPTATITGQTVTWLAADQTMHLTLTADETAALDQALTLQASGNKNNGAIGWTYSIADSKLDFLGEDQKVKVVSTITLDDHQGGTDTAEVTVWITGANDKPTLADVSAGTLTDTGASDTFSDLTGTLAGADADTGETATLTYAVLDANSQASSTPVEGQYGSLQVASDGSYTYVAHPDKINALPAGSYSDTFTVQTTDVHGAFGTATLTVDITGANDKPTLADVNAGTLTDTGASDTFSDLTGTLAGADADTGETATLTYTVLDANSQASATPVEGQYGSLSIASDGSYTYVAHPDKINALPAGSYTDTFTVQTTDVHGAFGTATLTVNVTGANDAPALDAATLTAISGDDSNPSGTAVSDLFAGKFHDADNGASLTAVAVTADNATSDQGVWQYEVAGSDAWVDISGVGDASALVLSTDTLIRFVPADGFSGTPGMLDVHALDNTYAGAVTAATPVSIDITAAGIDHGGTTPVSDEAASIGTEVTAPAYVPTVTLVGLDDSGNAIESRALTAEVNDLNAPTGSGITYNFEVFDADHSGWVSVQSGHSSSYTPTEAIEGDQIRVEVTYTATNGQAEDIIVSAGTVQQDPNAPIHVHLTGVDFSGNAVENQTLFAQIDGPDAPSGSGIIYSFEVYEADHSGWVMLQHGSGNSYTPTEAIEGEQVQVEAFYTDLQGQLQRLVAPAGTVQEDPNESAHVELTGLDGNNAVDGMTVYATVTDDDAPSGSGITYIFQTYDVNTSSWSIVQQGGGNSYTPGESDDGKSLKVDVQFTDTHGNFETGTASAGIVQAAAPEPPPVVQDFTADAQVSSGLDSISGTLPGTVDRTVIGVSTDGVNFTPVTLDMSGKVTGTYFNFTVGADGIDTLQVGVPSYPDAASLIAAIEGNEHNSTPLTETFYYELKDGDGNLTIDDITFNLTDLTFTGEIASHTTVGTPVSLGSLQVHDWGVTEGFDPSTLSVTVHVSAGVLWSSQFPAPGSSETFADDQTVTITGDQSQIEADLANLNLTSFAPGEIDVLISGVDGPARTPTYSAGSIDVSSPGYINIWTGAAADQSWNTNGNWSLGHIPTASETAVLDANGTVQLALDDNGYIIGGLSLSFTTELDIAGTGYNADAGGVDSYLLVNGQLTNASTIHVVDGTLEAFGHVTNVGTIVADGSYAMLDFANLTGSVIDGGDDGVIMAENGAQIEFGYNTVNGGAILSTGDDSIVHFQQTILNGTELYSNDSSNFEVDGPTTFNGSDSPISISGALVVETYGKLVLDGAVNDFGWIDNDGTMVVESGLTEVKFGISGSGTVEILAGTLEVGADSAIAVQFVGSGAGTLRVDYAAHFTGTVTGFGYGDTIDLAVSPDKVSFESSEGGLKVHYGSGDGDYFTVTGGYDATGFTTADDGNGGTDIVWSHQSPVIDTTHFTHVHDEATNTDTLTDLSVAGSSSEAYTVSAVTAGHGDGTGVTPSYLGDLSLDQLNDDLDSGVTYDPGNSPPTNDKIAFTVTDSFGASDTVNFIFNEGGSGPVFLTGTTGKDVMFASESSDTLDGNGGQDQFVFTPGSSSDSVQHTILDFDTTLDKIDLRQFDNINSFSDIIITQQSVDALVTLDNHESILLKNVVIGNLHASDFIVTNHSGGGII
nr:VCBS domain-containing protein [Bradyrhizobium diazoefficiens]